MAGTIPAIYENGVLRLLTPLALPEHTVVEIQIVKPTSATETERQRVRQVLAEAGVIQPQAVTEAIQPVSETDLAAAAQALGQAGPLSALIIAERAGR
jgi:predicted DNA-binding antitoxin AbrB/MazE fold protein